MPRIYPVIATRHRTAELIEQLRRLVPQLRDGERIVVVVDDCPATVKALARPQAFSLDNQVAVIPLASNVGVDRARRIGNSFVPARGIICEIDDHDWAAPELLAEVREAFINPHTCIVYCDAILTEPQRKIKTPRNKEPGLFRDNGMLGFGMKAYRKWSYDAVGGYPLEFFPANDLALMCKIEQLHHLAGIVHIPKPLVEAVLDVASISGRNKAAQQEAAARVIEIACTGGFKLPFALTAPRQTAQQEASVRTVNSERFAAAPTQAAGERRMPRVLLLTKIIGVGRGGGELSMLAMLRQAHAQGYEVCGLYAKDAGDTPSVPEWMKAQRLELKNWEDPDAVTQAVLAARPDVIVTEVRTAPLAIRVSERTGIPVVTMVQFWHNIVETNEGGLTAVQQRPIPDGHWHPNRELLAKSAGFVANSDFTAEVVNEAFGRRPTSIVYPPIDLERVRPEAAKPVSQRTLVVCPSVQEGKGSLIFLQLAKRNPDLRFLLLAGDDRHSQEEDVLKFAESLPNVTVRRDWVADMREVYRDCRLMFVGTQTAESFCRAAAESIACGIPLLVSDAGNLPRLVTPERGVVVERHAPIEQWDLALQTALALTPEPDARFCNTDSSGFRAALDAHRRLSDVAMVVPQAAGITVGAAQFRAVCGMDLLDWECGPRDLEPYALAISAGAHRRDLSDAFKGRMAYWWCSHFTQMDTSRHEMRGLLDVLEELKRRGDRYLFLTSEPSARALAALTRCDRVKWLPNVYGLKPFAPGEKLPGRHVWLIGPYVARKNVFAALSAGALAGAELHASAWLRTQCEEAVRQAEMLGVTLHLHDCANAEAVSAAAAQCGAAVALSTAETYCLAAIQCVEGGTPTVAWPGIPALAESPAELLIADPADVVSAAKSLTIALDGGPEIAARQHKAVGGTLARLNAQARATLMEVLRA